jgi:phosphoribosylformylglycinamidine (FGAM) synthase-like enzyme
MIPPHTSMHLLYLQLAPADIALVKFLFESYEGVGIVRTVDRRAAIIVVLVVEDFLPVARAIVRELQMQIACTEIDAPPLDADDWLMREISAAS